MRVLVTGATGFIGRHLVSALLRRGHSVRAVARSAEKAKAAPWIANVEFLDRDLHAEGLDVESLTKNIDAMAHLAWHGLPNYSELFHFERNLMGDYNFLKAAVDVGLRHLLVTGTCLEYGVREGALSEDTVTAPTVAYGVAKDALRQFLEALARQRDFALQWARLFYVYGPGQNPKSLLSQFETAVQAGDRVFNMSGGEQLRDYLSVTTVAEMLASLLERPDIRGSVNCSSGRPISVRRLVEARVAELGARIELNLGFYPYPEYEPMAFWGTSKHQLLLDADSAVVFRQVGLPVFQNRVYPDVESARVAAVGDVELHQCPGTGLVFNARFDASKLVYDEGYQNEQALSASFQQHLREVLRVVARHFPRGQPGVEIGCGKGYFLERLLDAGYDAVGLDPAYQGINPAVRRQLFDSSYDGPSPAFVVMRHVLEHIPDPWMFLQGVGSRCSPGCLIYIEVPCFDWIMKNSAFFDVFYEHCNYFTWDVLGRAFTDVKEIGRLFGDQYLYLLADASSFRRPSGPFRALGPLPILAQKARIAAALQPDYRTLVWGAGAKGVTLANILWRDGVRVDALIDINPAKQGKYIGLSGLPVLAPDQAIAGGEPANVIVVNSIYEREIRQMLQTRTINFVMADAK